MARRRDRIKAHQLEQSAFEAGLNFEIPQEVNDAVDLYLAGEPTFESDPERRAQLFEAEVKRPALDVFRDETVRSILQDAATSGGRGPVVAAELGDAARRLATNIGSLRSQFFRADEDREIAAKEAALGRVAQGATARLSESVLPIQLRAALGSQARGAEGADALQGFLKNFLAQSKEQGNALAAAIQGSVPTPFQFEGDTPSSGLLF